MKKLQSASVSRGGRTSNTWTHETNDVGLTTIGGRSNEKTVALRFSMKSKGGGITDVSVRVGAADFAAVLAEMVNCDRKLVLPLLAEVLKAELERQAEIEKAQVRAIRRSVVAAAERAFEDAPEGRDHAERLTRDMVSLLVDQLNKADDAAGGGERSA